MLLNLLDDLIRAPASCKVMISFQEIDDLYPMMVSLNATLPSKDSAEATIIFETRRLEDGSWIIQDDARIRPWSVISISATFDDREDPIFEGFIRQVKIEYPEDQGSASVTVTCQDAGLLLDRTQRTFRWGDEVPVSDGFIASEILNDAQLSFLEPPAAGFNDINANQNETDIKFLKKRAQENNFDIFFREGQLYFGPQRFSLDAQPTVLFYAGTDSHGINFSIDDDGHHPEAIIYEIANEDDDSTNEVEVASNLEALGNDDARSSELAQGNFSWRLSREGLTTENQAQQKAQAIANSEALRITGSGELDGTRYGHVLLPGDPVELDGLGDTHSGKWYVTKVEHSFSMEGYRQMFEVARNAYGDNVRSLSNPIANLL